MGVGGDDCLWFKETLNPKEGQNFAQITLNGSFININEFFDTPHHKEE